ncbi:MAG: hypothetical protein JXR19_05120 [Bacteroidia bacterium]
MRRNCLLIIFLLCAFIGRAQESIPIGQWRIHLPYNSVTQLVETPQLLYVVGEIGFYSFHKLSGEIELYSKVNGFSDTEVKTLAYSDDHNTLIIGYRNTNVDLLKEGKIINIQGILRKTIIGKKEINEIQVFGDFAYVSCSFGVVVIDLVEQEIKDSYLNIGPGGTNLDVLTTALYKDSIYLGTTDGIYGALVSNQVNLSDFSSWSLFKSSTGADFLRVYNNELLFVEDSVVYSYDGSYSLFWIGSKQDYKSITSNHGKLVVTYTNGIYVFDNGSWDRNVAEKFKDYAVVDHQNNIWCGGFYTGMVKITPAGQQSSLRPQGPFGPTTFEMEGLGNQMWVTSGGHSTIYAPTFTNTGYYMFEKGKWTNRPTNVPELSSMYDFTSIEINQNNGDIWMGTHGTGLCQLNRGDFVARYDSDNTPLLKDATGSDFTYVLGLGLDSKENLWMTNFETDKALVVRMQDGSWDSYDVGEQRLGEMVVDEFDQKWMALERESSKGILVFKEDEEGVNPPLVRVLTTSVNGGGLPSNVVNAMVLDRDGEIWVGTETGLAIFYNPSLVFEGGKNADAQQIIIDDGEDVGYLLGNEVINDIKIDGANRKWVATNNGAWLIKEDGSEVLLHLTVSNSPLPSNTVNCVGVEPVTGEIFFGTTGGMVSYRGDATSAKVDEANPLVFPNPVHKDYDGPITITGLYEDATVKIADVAGRVVYEMIATGGTAVWDGRNFSGERPQTGVYLIFSSTKDDEDALVSKLLIVR